MRGLMRKPNMAGNFMLLIAGLPDDPAPLV